MGGVAAGIAVDVEGMESTGGKESERSDGMVGTSLRADGEGGGTG